jgi:hypothetical protein
MVNIGNCKESQLRCATIWMSTDVSNDPAPIIPKSPLTERKPDNSIQSETFLDPLPVPLMHQDDYPNDILGSGKSCGSIATYGCWLTSYAMVFNYFEDGFTTPPRT